MNTFASPEDQAFVIETFERLGALQYGHFVYTSGKHGEVYVAKDLVFPTVNVVEDLAMLICDNFSGELIDTVIGIAPIGAILASHVACWIQKKDYWPCFAIFAEKKANGLEIRKPLQRFVGPNQRILVVEDILNTGSSAKNLADLVIRTGGELVAVAAIWNRGNVTDEQLGTNVFSLCREQYFAWDEAECPLCEQGVPINTDLGHGKEFLSKKASA